ncbi:MAG: 2-amino-4-hydroxy-6-hydroxymethyldihydropteridine diphosphokinase [Planctomycetota bacterium]
MTGETAYIALGSNQGDRRDHLDRGLRAIASLPATRLLRCSSYHWTPPWGLRDQPWFLNAAAAVVTELPPQALLEGLLGAERDAGRVRAEPWGPRTLDLDILLYGDRVVEEEGLALPHPRMTERAFVLEPLAEIAADVIHPVSGRSVGDHLADLREAESTASRKEGGVEPS